MPELLVIVTSARGVSRAMHVALKNVLVDCVTLKKACFSIWRKKSNEERITSDSLENSMWKRAADRGGKGSNY